MLTRFLLFGFLLLSFFSAAQVVDTARVRVEVDSLVQLNRKLVGQSKFGEALRVIEMADSMALGAFGRNHDLHALCLFNHGRTYHNMRKYEEAEPLYLEALAIREKMLGKVHPDYAKSLNNLALLYENNNEFDKAEPLYLEALAIREKVFGKGHLDYAKSLFNLANNYFNNGKPDKAEPLYLEALAIRGKVLGKENLDYAWSLLNLANLYKNKGVYDKAEQFYLEALAIRGKVLGKEHPDYAQNLDNLANLYLKKAEFDKAEPLYLEALAIQGNAHGKGTPDYAEILYDLACLYKNKGVYDRSEFLYLEAKVIQEKVLGKENLGYANTLYGLATLYYHKGEYDRAEPLYLESIAIQGKVRGKENTNYTNALNNLGLLYKDKGEYDKAESLLLESKAIREKVLGKESSEYAFSLDGLASLYMDIGGYDKAERLYLEAKSILEKVLGKESSNYAINTDDLALLYFYKREYNKAEPLFLEAKAIREKVLGKEHPEYATTLSNLALLYLNKGEYNKAQPLFFEALAIREKVLGKEHPEYAWSLYHLALLYRDLGQQKKSEPYFTEASSITKRIIQKSSTYLPSQELEKYISQYSIENDAFYSLNHQSSSDTFRIASYNNALFYKGFALETATRLEQAMQSAPDSIRDIHSRWKGYNRLLAAELALPIAERKYTVYLDSMSNVLEKVLLRAAPAFAEDQRQVEWQDVRDALQLGEAAIEFIHYTYSDKSETDSTMYSALVTMPGGAAPQFISLCEARQLDALIYKPDGTRANYLLTLYASPRKDGLPSLNQLLWAPLEKVLREKGIKTVYYSPTGLLHRLNLGAISEGKSGARLTDNYHLVPMGSTRQLATAHTEIRTPNSALIYGGIRYEMDSSAITRANTKQGATPQDTTGGLFGFSRQPDGRSGENWNYLPGTEQEALYLDSLLHRQGINTTLRLGYNATEESFKQIGQNGPSPSLLHIGTHGFFFPDPQDSSRRRAALNGDEPVFKISEYSMIRSGLKLAGSRYAWENGHPLPGGHEDGILTAYEVSQMNLSNTELVVLSACETGLGDIRGNEGVYGLQRAFRIAGAKNVLMSLWKVPDDATKKLMTRFYSNWLAEKKPLRKSFEEAQQWLRGQKGFENPYFWAGFVLVGEL